MLSWLPSELKAGNGAPAGPEKNINSITDSKPGQLAIE